MNWQKIENPSDSRPQPYHFDDNDVNCYFARDYIPKGGYKASEANQLINNFKKPVSTRGSGQWIWKKRACEQFARELGGALHEEALPHTVVAPIPTSHIRTDSDYDPRCDMMLAELNSFRSTVRTETIIERAYTLPSMHGGGTKRSIITVYNSLRWLGFRTNVPTYVVLFDDVITCGTHFKACQRMIKENHPEIIVFGFFWARTVWPKPDQSES